MKTSIRLSLLRWLILPLMAINLCGAAMVYWLAWVPAEHAFDQGLADSAWALIPQLRLVDNRIDIDLPKPAEQILRVDHTDAIYFTVRTPHGRTVAGDNDFPAMPDDSRLGEPVAYDGVMRGERVRIVVLHARVGERDVYIGAAETMHKRSTARLEILGTLAVMEFVVTLLLVGTIWFGIGRGLLPLDRVRHELDARQRDELTPLRNDDLSAELSPVIDAMNRLLERVRAGADAKQKFLADVAHQLRTPLAGLRTQLEWLRQRVAGDTEAVDSATQMIDTTTRMARHTNQLLSLARADPSQFQFVKLELIRLDKVIEDSVQQFVREADKKLIDLGFQLEPTMIAGDHFLLRDLVDNLIDNAIRYSPMRGSVTVSCRKEGGQGILVVEDEGPGIPEMAREMVFKRFFRIDDKAPGTGLGLAIVRDIVEDHQAAIEIGQAQGGKGTRIVVLFPPVKG